MNLNWICTRHIFGTCMVIILIAYGYGQITEHLENDRMQRHELKDITDKYNTLNTLADSGRFYDLLDMNDREFVVQMYVRYLGYEPSDGEFNSWYVLLQNEKRTKRSVLFSFLFMDENIEKSKFRNQYNECTREMEPKPTGNIMGDVYTLDIQYKESVRYNYTKVNALIGEHIEYAPWCDEFDETQMGRDCTAINFEFYFQHVLEKHTNEIR